MPCDVTRPQDRQTVVDVALDRYGACSSATCCPRGPTSSTPTVPRRARRPRAPVDLGGTRIGMLFGATTALLTEIAPTALLSPSRGPADGDISMGDELGSVESQSVG